MFPISPGRGRKVSVDWDSCLLSNQETLRTHHVSLNGPLYCHPCIQWSKSRAERRFLKHERTAPGMKVQRTRSKHLSSAKRGQQSRVPPLHVLLRKPNALRESIGEHRKNEICQEHVSEHSKAHHEGNEGFGGPELVGDHCKVCWETHRIVLEGTSFVQRQRRYNEPPHFSE